MNESIKSFLLIALLVCTQLLIASDVAKKVSEMTPDELRQLVVKRLKEKPMSQRILENTGGQIAKPNSGSGIVMLVNMQSKVTDRNINMIAERLTLKSKFNVRSMTVPSVPFSALDEQFKKMNVAAAVFIIDQQVLPPSLVAYELRWGMVNVAKLCKGSEKDLFHRLELMVFRTWANVCGAGDSAHAEKLMANINAIEDLDAVSIPTHPIPQMMISVGYHMKSVGLKPMKFTIYRKACEEGWAPAPTNAIQQAIWDKVHSMPAKPMKIEFDPKKGR